MIRNAKALALGALDRFSVVAIQGARRVGKSTLAATLVANRPHLIVSLDDVEQLALAREDPSGFLAQRRQATMVIDEVQRAPEVILAIKSQVDLINQPGQFVLTASSDFTASPNIPDSLAGRAVTIGLGSMSMGELAGVKEDFVTWLQNRLATEPPQASPWTRHEYIETIVKGGYPELRPLDDPWRALWADSYIDRLTARDALDIKTGLSAPRLRSVLGLIAANQAGELVKARLAAAASISERSATTCLDALQSLYLIATIPPWTANLTKRQVGRAKALVVDSGLAAHLSGASAEFLTQEVGSNALGPLLEGFVMAELLKQRTWSTTRWELNQFRDRNGLEVDGVIRFADGRVVLLEVKASQTYRSDHFAAMKRLAPELGDRLIAGVVLTLSNHPYQYADKLWGLPVSALWHHAHTAEL